MKTIKSIIVQISESEHRSEERAIVKFDTQEDDDRVVFTVASLTQEELLKYNEFVSMMTAKLNN